MFFQQLPVLKKIWGPMLEQNALGTDVVSKKASCKKALGSGVRKQLQEPMLNRNAGKKILGNQCYKKRFGNLLFLSQACFQKALGTDVRNKALGTHVLFDKCMLKRALGSDVTKQLWEPIFSTNAGSRKTFGNRC